jgi:hypothetical protein
MQTVAPINHCVYRATSGVSQQVHVQLTHVGAPCMSFVKQMNEGLDAGGPATQHQ